MNAILEKTARALTEKGYTVRVFDNRESAAEYMDKAIDGRTVGIGGSVTVKEMGLFPLLRTHNTVYWHDEKPENMTVAETRAAASSAEVYISSVNGMSEDGQIINIDNTGNRVAAITWGPRQVYLVTGINKIAPSYEEALWRARNIASPLNAMRLKRNTPCAVKGDRCYDCKSPERICRHLQVLWTKPAGVNIEVVLIDEKLGY